MESFFGLLPDTIEINNQVRIKLLHIPCATKEAGQGAHLREMWRLLVQSRRFLAWLWLAWSLLALTLSGFPLGCFNLVPQLKGGKTCFGSWVIAGNHLHRPTSVFCRQGNDQQCFLIRYGDCLLVQAKLWEAIKNTSTNFSFSAAKGSRSGFGVHVERHICPHFHFLHLQIQTPTSPTSKTPPPSLPVFSNSSTKVQFCSIASCINDTK